MKRAIYPAMHLRISFNNKRIAGAYGGGNQFAAALEKYLVSQGHEVFRELVPELDVILILSSRSLGITAYTVEQAAAYIARHPNTAMVLRVNTLDEPRGADYGDNQAMLDTAKIADYVIYVSDWVRQVFIKHGIDTTRPNGVILNSADPDIFNPAGRCHWQPGAKLKLVTHHWSTNYMKGFDIYERLDLLLGMKPYGDFFEFTYIGNVSLSVEFKNTRVIPPLEGEAVARELKQHHVYLTAARHEPGGNHYIEGVQCGLPILYLDSGSLREYCGEYGLGFTLVDFEQQLMALRERYDEFFEKVQHAPHTSDRMSRAYEQVFLSVVAERRAHPKPLPAPEPAVSLAKLARWPRRAAGRIRKAAKVLLYG